ncbi:MAG: SDR family NAD(P)-dependent oxidoreductase, partial [Sneathiella sp.]|nr:SDR family NAD(P)-dependent oxidoreductase [Sneathiella sp.]
YWAGYSASKAALEQLVLTYAEEVAKTNLKVNLIDPGPTATKLRLSAYPGEDQSTLPTADDKAAMFLNALASDFTENGTLIK